MSSIKLKWTPRVVGDKQRIYRSSLPFTKDNLPPVLATVGADVSEFLDQSSMVGENYYRIEALATNPVRSVLSEIVVGRAATPGAAPSLSVSAFDGVAGATAVFGVGFLKRNPWYLGPACRVEDVANPGTFTDVPFGPKGVVRGARPYGDNTRLVTMYDQWGSDNMTAPLHTNGIRIIEDDPANGIYCWRMDFLNASGATMLSSTNTTATAAWAVLHPYATSTFSRMDSVYLRLIWGVQKGLASGRFMGLGIWQEFSDLHSRVNGGNPFDWVGTHLTNNLAHVRELQVAAIDMSQRDGNTYGFFNGNPALTIPQNSWTSKSGRLTIGDWDLVGDRFRGTFVELHILDTTASMSSAGRAFMAAAGQEYKADPDA